MVKTIINGIGVAVGVLCILFSFMVFGLKADVTEPSMDTPRNVSSSYTIEEEPDKAYGGDAYTGMQQAAAQAANNMIAVNDSIKQTNANLETLNDNLAAQAEAQSENIAAVISAITTVGGYILLATGLLTVVKYGSALVEILLTKKETPVVAA